MRAGEAGRALSKDSPELIKLMQIFNPPNKRTETLSWLDELLREEMYSNKKADKALPRYQRSWESKPLPARHREFNGPSKPTLRGPQRDWRSKNYGTPYDTVLTRPKDLGMHKKSHTDEIIQRPWPKQRTSDTTDKYFLDGRQGWGK